MQCGLGDIKATLSDKVKVTTGGLTKLAIFYYLWPSDNTQHL